MMKLYPTFDEMPSEDKYIFEYLFVEPKRRGKWFAVDMHTSQHISRLVSCMTNEYKYTILWGPDDSPFCYLMVY